MFSRHRLARPFLLALLRASAEARAQKFHEAETELRTVVAADPNDSALHFALGTMLRQQEQYDDAYDELVAALKPMPDLPENHSALSYLFYRLDDGPNAIAEASHSTQHRSEKFGKLTNSLG